ncbi:MAG: hypothetical protein JXB36_15325 [Gammaproteobacteria bacterium]|nr:hypothetical protein [Gammaproteobacteria bacterium]
MSALRLLVLAINAAAGVAVLLIGFVALVVSSETGSARIAGHALDRMPVEIAVGGIDGTLAGGLVLEDVTLAARAGIGKAERALLYFSASSFFARAAVLNRIELRDVVWMPAAAGADGAAAAARPHRPGAPLPIVVRDAAANALTLSGPGGELRLHGLRASGRWVGRRLVVDEFRGDSTGVALTGRGEVDWAGGVSLRADLNWAGRSAGEHAAGYLSVDGTLPTLELRHELLSPAELNLRADAAVGEGPVLELDPLALDTDRGTLTGRGRLALDTTAWELTLDARGESSSAPLPEAGGGRLRFSGQLLPRPEWRRLPSSAAAGG